MNPETIRILLTQAAPLLSEWLTSKPSPQDAIRMSGERFIDFLKACPADTQVIANAIDPTQTYVFGTDALRELANPFRRTVSYPGPIGDATSSPGVS